MESNKATSESGQPAALDAGERRIGTMTQKWMEELERKVGEPAGAGAVLLDNGTVIGGPRVWRLLDGRVVACFDGEEAAVVIPTA